jgi:hypothetical protein
MRAKRIAVTFKFEVTIPEWIVFTDAQHDRKCSGLKTFPPHAGCCEWNWRWGVGGKREEEEGVGEKEGGRQSAVFKFGVGRCIESAQREEEEGRPQQQRLSTRTHTHSHAEWDRKSLIKPQQISVLARA